MPSFDGFLTPNVITNYPRGQSKNSENVKCKWNLHITFTRRRSWRFAEYCKRFVARLNDVHAFGYNSAESERIWMKFGELWDYCSELSLTNFGRDPRRRGSGRASRNFVFFGPLNDARFHRLPIGQISGNLHKKTCFRVRMCRSGNICENLPVRGLFSPKTSKGGWFSSTISDFRNRFLRNDYISWKVMTGWTACGMLTFHWRRWNELKVIPLACNPRTRKAISPPNHSSTTSIRDDFTACCITLNGCT